jgi:hypothetical protein
VTQSGRRAQDSHLSECHGAGGAQAGRRDC